MGEMSRYGIIVTLQASNPHPRSVTAIELFADAFIEYRLAQANIAEHGPVTLHPRTGAPIANPYLAVRDRAAKTLSTSKLDASGVWGSAKVKR